MGAYHVHTYLAASLAFAGASLVPLSVLALMVGAWWESHRRHHGRRARAGGHRTALAARFATTPD